MASDELKVKKLRFSALPGRYAIARLGHRARIPTWARQGVFFSITRTREELSLVVAEAAVPARMRAERGWRMLKLRGPFPFTATGVLSSVLAPLARAQISVFALSTFDTDYVLVKEESLTKALGVLKRAGHRHLR